MHYAKNAKSFGETFRTTKGYLDLQHQETQKTNHQSIMIIYLHPIITFNNTKHIVSSWDMIKHNIQGGGDELHGIKTSTHGVKNPF